MAAEKLESWSFCLSRKPSRSGWDVETTRSGYGYENCKANVLMDYKGWTIVRSRKGNDTPSLQEITPMAAEKLESWSFCLSRKPSRSGWDVETTRSGYGYENCKANVLMDYKGWYIVRSRKVR